MLRSSTLRLAALYTAIFAAAVIVLGVLTVTSLRAGLSGIFEAAIRNEAIALEVEYKTEGLEAVVFAVRDRDKTIPHHYYGLESPGGQALAGRLAGRKIANGWSTLKLVDGGRNVHVRCYAAVLADDHRVIVGDDAARVEQLDGDILKGFVGALMGVVLLGAFGGYWLSRGVHRRLEAIAVTAEAFSEGELSRRTPIGGGADDLDRLAVTLNRMFDRIAQLMESLRQVSNDIAHDLRTPLTRLRQHLEAGLAHKERSGQTAALEGALTELDGILETFSALLRISQVDSGARRAAFRPVDLTQIAATVVEAFAPSAEEEGRALSLGPGKAVIIDGDLELLTQMLVNLVENALRHTPAGAHIVVDVGLFEDRPALTVIDDGPGIAASERERVLERFYRLELSRSMPGSGLGLSLVSAIARLHGAELRLGDAGPGLAARVIFAA